MKSAFNSILQKKPFPFLLQVANLYDRCGGMQAAAALAYFLVLTLFPMLLCVNYGIGLFRMSLDQALISLEQFLPLQAVQIMQEYLRYASENRSVTLFILSLFTILFSGSAGIRSLFFAIDRLYDKEPANSVRAIAISVLLSVFFLLTIYFSIAVIFTGEWFFQPAGNLAAPIPG